MTNKTTILGVSLAAVFAVAFLGYAPISEALSPITTNTERDNIVLTGIKLDKNERMIVLDNAGAFAFQGLQTTSSVEVTARFSEDSTCSVEVIDPSIGLVWDVLVDQSSAPFPVSSPNEENVPVHDDRNGVAAVSVYGGDEGCDLDNDGEYINISTFQTTGLP